MRTEIAVSRKGAKHTKTAKKIEDFAMRFFAALRLCVSCVDSLTLLPETVHFGHLPAICRMFTFLAPFFPVPTELQPEPARGCVSLTAQKVLCYVEDLKDRAVHCL